ncbi:glycoside hydrolase family 13 protein [Exiguobacterium flavidum]|uniref:glycoside hydrolase family 13 protein n=1 Tax=Exiguobacterium flavidum TaxID=2184695 RepID=UPI000DF72CEF|nr:alpha-glucosidase [Exiguobacterium flavidum]
MEVAWWKEAVVYQVYWRSFFDTDGDGYGDLRGVTQKLDYIASLGVDVIWLNPCYASPDVDNGYDISDYRAVMPKAGTMEDLEQLFREAQARGLKVIMDLVVNHTSDRHAWFADSKANGAKRDWYIWRDGKEGGPPTNWRSYFAPSTWTWCEERKQYYFHSFAKEQPDLNWENPQVREAIYAMMRFWVDKGIDGFRMDVINLIKKREFTDVADPFEMSYLANQPGIHDFLQEMNREVGLDRLFTVGEIPFVGPEDGLLYVGEDRGELHTLFHFEVADDMTTMDLPRFKQIQQRWFDALYPKGVASQFLNNHDHTRQVTRFGSEKFRVESAKLLGLMLHTLPGIPYIYQGEEIGMTGMRFDRAEDYPDVAFRNRYKERIENGEAPEMVLSSMQLLARDNSRTPVQWDASRNAGFSAGQPWIPVNPNYEEINVEAAEDDADSVLHFYRKLTAMRKEHPVMVYGTYRDLAPNDPYLYVYERTLDDTTWRIVLNIRDEETESVHCPDGECMISNYPDSCATILQPYEARLYML